MRARVWKTMVVALAAMFPVTVAADDDAYDASRLEESKQRYPADEGNVTAGKEVYLKYCAFCHGDKGGGDGGAAPYLDPRPRDFTAGLFKFRSTLTGELPTDEDLFRIIARGVTGTAMPAWGEPPAALADEELWQVVHYLKELSTEDFADPDFDPYEEKLEIPPAPAYNPSRVASGRSLYADEKKGGCVKCHGNEGRGDGKEAGTQRDDWGDDILPADLTRSWHYKNGSSLVEIFRTLSTGLNGTPMPGYAETLSEGERWDLTCYVWSLQVERRPEAETVLLARKHEGPLPLDPADPFWGQQTGIDVPLAGQAVVTPRQVNSTINLVTVRATYNDEEVAFHFTWNDRFKDASAESEERWVPELEGSDSFARAAEIWARRKRNFADRLQIQFPVKIQEGPTKPFFFMGGARNKVNLWTWQADWNEDPAGHHGRVAAERNAAGYNKAPATQEQGSQALAGGALFADGRWQLVLKRPLTTADGKLATQFEPGVFIPFALQAWDGGNGEEGLLCAISSWYYVVLEGRIDRAGYLYAFLGVLLTLGGEALVVRRVRKSDPHLPRH